jgi:uncharacterized membrane protein YagU involved in acid resistance
MPYFFYAGRGLSSIAKQLVVGLAAGVAAAWAMNAFQEGWAKVIAAPPRGKTAATKAADAISKDVSGSPVKHSAQKEADSVMHYLTGAALGGLYEVVGKIFPRFMATRGVAFGMLAWLFCDEMAVPILGFGPPPPKIKGRDHVFALASHVFFGVVLDWVRRPLIAVISSGGI